MLQLSPHSVASSVAAPLEGDGAGVGGGGWGEHYGTNFTVTTVWNTGETGDINTIPKCNIFYVESYGYNCSYLGFEQQQQGIHKQETKESAQNPPTPP